MASLLIYTDGSCSPNPGKGGWAFVVVREDEPLIKTGFSESTTNNIMELTACIEAIKFGESRPMTIVTDSMYVKEGITNWMQKWKKNGWKTSNNTAVKNKELWIALDLVATGKNITWKWVKGHDRDKYNELANASANDARLSHS